MKKNICLSTIVYVLFLLIVSCNSQDGNKNNFTKTNISKKEIDKSKLDTLIENENYVLVYYKNDEKYHDWLDLDTSYETRGLILIKKPNKELLAKLASGKVPSDIDTAELTASIGNSINFNGGLHRTTEFIDFDLVAVLDYLRKAKEVGIRKIPDSIRAYIHRYPATHNIYPDRNSVAFVVINEGMDLFHNDFPDTRPQNLGRLCPPDCEDVYETAQRPKNDTGAILYRAGTYKSNFPLP